MNRTLIAAVLIAASSLATAAHAAESPGSRIASAAGLWIAEQGNQALREIREEVRDRLLENLRPLLPAPAPAAAPPSASVSAAGGR